MTPEERAGYEAEADRFRRRGELGKALALFQAIQAAFPDDTAVAARIALLQDALQPLELHHPKANHSEGHGVEEPSLELLAEQAAYRNDFATAISLYRQALQAKPDSELLKERLAQLFQQVREHPTASTAAPRPPEPAPSASPAAVAPEAALRSYLERITARRRRP